MNRLLLIACVVLVLAVIATQAKPENKREEMKALKRALEHAKEKALADKKREMTKALRARAISRDALKRRAEAAMAHKKRQLELESSSDSSSLSSSSSSSASPSSSSSSPSSGVSSSSSSASPSGSSSSDWWPQSWSSFQWSDSDWEWPESWSSFEWSDWEWPESWSSWSDAESWDWEWPESWGEEPSWYEKRALKQAEGKRCLHKKSESTHKGAKLVVELRKRPMKIQALKQHLAEKESKREGSRLPPKPDRHPKPKGPKPEGPKPEAPKPEAPKPRPEEEGSGFSSDFEWKDPWSSDFSDLEWKDSWGSFPSWFPESWLEKGEEKGEEKEGKPKEDRRVKSLEAALKRRKMDSH